MPTRLLHRVLQIVLHLVGVLARSPRSNGASDACIAALDRAVVHARRAVARERAAYSPARLPNTIRSDSELPPSRLAPLMPDGALARGEQPGNRRHLRVGVHADAAHDVVRRRPDLHRLLGDVEVGQLLELVIHARELALDVLLGVRELLLDPGDVEEHAAVRRAAAGLDLAVDAARHVIARQQLGRTPRALVALRVAPAFFRIGPSAACSCPGCRRT